MSREAFLLMANLPLWIVGERRGVVLHVVGEGQVNKIEQVHVVADKSTKWTCGREKVPNAVGFSCIMGSNMGTRSSPSPGGQTDTTENITFPQLR